MSVVDIELQPFDLREVLWAPQPTAAETARRCLLCEAGEARFALPIEYLRSVEPNALVTPLPQLPDWVLGVTNVRGSVVGVVDLARFLGLGAAPAGRGRLLICGTGERQVALAVTAARSVLDYPPAALQEAPSIEGRVGRYVAGLVPTNEAAVPLLDIARLVADEELVRG
ncbi:MAG TPA: chemotaxis protein CheW [Chloroflexota bacterium]|jgi:purine-binding chemotaxis protein CheW